MLQKCVPSALHLIVLFIDDDLFENVKIISHIRLVSFLIFPSFSPAYSLYLFRHSTSIIPTLDPETQAAAIFAYSKAMRTVFIGQAALNFITFLCCLPIQENPLP